MHAVRVLLADDHPLVLDALVDLLEPCPDLHVVSTAPDGDAAREAARLERPDLALVDVRMPAGGPDLVHDLLDALPDLCVVVFSAERDQAVRAAMLDAGARTFLAKGDPDLDIVEALRALMAEPDLPEPEETPA